MRDRHDPAIADAVAELLPTLASDAVRLLAAALSAPRVLEDAGSARRALAAQLAERPRWSAEQVIESTAPVVLTDDDDAALAAALRALPAGDRTAVVLGGATDSAMARLRADLARRDEDER